MPTTLHGRETLCKFTDLVKFIYKTHTEPMHLKLKSNLQSCELFMKYMYILHLLICMKHYIFSILFQVYVNP